MTKHAAEKRSVTTIRLEGDLLQQLDRIGDAEQRSRSWLIEQAVREFVAKREAVKRKR